MGEEPINLNIDDAMKAMLEVFSEPIRRNAEHWSAVHASKGRWASLPAQPFMSFFNTGSAQQAMPPFLFGSNSAQMPFSWTCTDESFGGKLLQQTLFEACKRQLPTCLTAANLGRSQTPRKTS